MRCSYSRSTEFKVSIALIKSKSSTIIIKNKKQNQFDKKKYKKNYDFMTFIALKNPLIIQQIYVIKKQAILIICSIMHDRFMEFLHILCRVK